LKHPQGIFPENLDNFRIILASQSPRRQQLLKELGLKFEVVSRDYDENYPEHLKGEEIAKYLAQSKASQLRTEIKDNEIYITADTIVWCNEKLLGKPLDYEDAIRMLKEISANTHEVITGVSLSSKSKEKTFSVSTKVTFELISDEEMNYYVEMFKPYDKAGAYGIQEWIGLASCSHIVGSYFNVVGLPVHRLFKELKSFIDKL
jgi:septum formation protein